LFFEKRSKQLLIVMAVDFPGSVSPDSQGFLVLFLNFLVLFLKKNPCPLGSALDSG
jgi:hypothetical protein